MNNNNQQIPVPFNGGAVPNMPNPMAGPPGFMNGPNGLMGTANLGVIGSPHRPSNPQMGFGAHCGNMNPIRGFGHSNNGPGFPQFNPNAMGFPYGQFCPPNGVGFQGVNQFAGMQMVPNASHFVHPNGFGGMVPQNPGFMNPQYANMHYNQMVHQPLPMQMSDANSGNPSSVAAQQLQGNSSNNAPRSSNQSEQTHFGAPGNSGRRDPGLNASRGNWKNQSNKNFSRNPKRGMKHGGPQNPQFHQTRGGRRNFGSPNARGRGPSNDERAPPGFGNHENQGNEQRKPRILTYSKQEAQQWQDERRKNYPSKDNIKKKLADKAANKESIEKEAQLRREQLKEILAKQAELGVEVAEIPGLHLSDAVKSGQGRRENNGRFQNRFEKRGRHDKRDRYPKKQRLNNNAPPPRPKKPSLLEKLLSADVKRDKCHLLQAFRFILLNSFFDGPDDKTLKFPTISVNDVTEEMDHNERENFADANDATVVRAVESDEDGDGRKRKDDEEVKEEEGEII